MKKILFIGALGVLMAMGSCSKAAKEEKCEASAFQTKIENCTNPDSLKIYVEQAKDYAQQLVSEGKLEEAKKYMDQLGPVIKEKAPALASTFDAVRTAIDKVPGTAENVKSEASAAVDSLGAAAENVKNAAENKAGEVVNGAKEAAGNAVNTAVQNAGNAINNALSK